MLRHVARSNHPGSVNPAARPKCQVKPCSVKPDCGYTSQRYQNKQASTGEGGSSRTAVRGCLKGRRAYERSLDWRLDPLLARHPPRSVPAISRSDLRPQSVVNAGLEAYRQGGPRAAARAACASAPRPLSIPVPKPAGSPSGLAIYPLVTSRVREPCTPLTRRRAAKCEILRNCAVKAVKPPDCTRLLGLGEAYNNAPPLG